MRLGCGAVWISPQPVVARKKVPSLGGVQGPMKSPPRMKTGAWKGLAGLRILKEVMLTG